MKIRRFHKVNEDVQPAPSTPQQSAQATAAQPAAQPAPQLAQQPAAQPTAPATPAPQQSESNQKMMTFLNDFKSQIEQHASAGDGIYWALTYNLPEEIQKAVPDFKQGNPDAAAGINAWNTYKQNPSQQSFQTLADELAKYGTQQQQQNAQAAPVQQQPVVQQNTQMPSTQNAATAPAQTAAAAQAQQESVMKSFGKKLQESLERQLHNERIHNAIV